MEITFAPIDTDPIDAAPIDPGQPLALEQHGSFAAALRMIGREAHCLRVVSGNRPVADVLMIRRRLFGMVQTGLVLRGPVWAGDASTGDRIQALRALRRAGVRLIEANAAEPALRRAGFRQVATAAHVASLDLTGTAADRRRALDPAWRNKLCKAERADQTIRCLPFNGDPDHWLLGAEAAQRRMRAYRTLPQVLTCAFARANPGQALIWQAEMAGAPVAGMIMLRHGRAATYHLGWTGPAGRAVAAHQRLLMVAADGLAALGHLRLDLGTVDTEGAEGLARFKLGSGASARALGGSWLGVPGV